MSGNRPTTPKRDTTRTCPLDKRIPSWYNCLTFKSTMPRIAPPALLDKTITPHTNPSFLPPSSPLPAPSSIVRRPIKGMFAPQKKALGCRRRCPPPPLSAAAHDVRRPTAPPDPPRQTYPPSVTHHRPHHKGETRLRHDPWVTRCGSPAPAIVFRWIGQHAHHLQHWRMTTPWGGLVIGLLRGTMRGMWDFAAADPGTWRG